MRCPGLLFVLAFLTACSGTLPALEEVEIPISQTPSATHTWTPPQFTASPTLPANTTTFTPTSTFTFTPTETAIHFTYVFPIQPAEVADFAEGTAGHGYPATDIFAPEGTSFVAVTDGVVDFVSYSDTWDPSADDPAVRGGISIAIIGDDGVRYYGSHLSAIAEGIQVGMRVQVGQILGFVGMSGNARNKDAHVHFGISRPTYPEDWKARRGQVDPFPFLQAWQDGHNITPPLPEQ
jgi:peptidoglycan LD-endopeptidase LytH